MTEYSHNSDEYIAGCRAMWIHMILLAICDRVDPRVGTAAQCDAINWLRDETEPDLDPGQGIICYGGGAYWASLLGFHVGAMERRIPSLKKWIAEQDIPATKELLPYVREFFIAEAIKQDMTCGQIASAFSCSESAVWRIARKFGLSVAEYDRKWSILSSDLPEELVHALSLSDWRTEPQAA